MSVADEIRAEFARKERERPPFVAGVTPVPPSGKVFDAEELVLGVEAVLDGWWTTGRFAHRFERELARATGVRHALLTNSGSSANLLALSCLTSRSLGERALRSGDEVITTASSFPTTVNPILQNGLVPVLVDVTLPTYNIDLSALEAALSARTRAVMVAHTLGNPFAAAEVAEFCRAHGLWLIEDMCDALGATYDGRPVGTFGDLATISFYPAHHITMGEGGAVITQSPVLRRLVESFRDWGRDCWCDPGEDNRCGKRFEWQQGDLPFAYDHKYTYSHIGYNLKVTDMQAAIGLAQLAKLDTFVEARRRNFAYLRARLEALEDVLVLPEPTARSQPSWFGFPVTVREAAPFGRAELLARLEGAKIGTRLLFGGNVVRQPAYEGVAFRRVGSLETADRVMRDTFWVGVYPGLTEAHLDHTADTMLRFAAERRSLA